MIITFKNYELNIDEKIARKYGELMFEPVGSKAFVLGMEAMLIALFNTDDIETIFKTHKKKEIEEKITKIMLREIEDLS